MCGDHRHHRTGRPEVAYAETKAALNCDVVIGLAELFDGLGLDDMPGDGIGGDEVAPGQVCHCLAVSA